MKITYKVAILLIATITFGACSKTWIDPSINNDPDKLTEISMSSLVPSIEAELGYVYGGMDVAGYSAIWMQQIKGVDRQAGAVDNYNITAADVNNAWNTFYSGPMENAHYLMQLADQKKSPHYKGVAQVLMAVALGTVTDLWGDVPYSEAFKGSDNFSPKFDSQKDIYTAINSLLTDAISNLESTTNVVDLPSDGSDFIYDGDASLWVKAAYTLRARYAMHLLKLGSVNYGNVLSDLSKGISNATENMAQPFGNSQSSANPMFQFNDQRSGYITDNNYFQNMLSTANDPRASELTFDGFWAQIGASVEFTQYTEALFLKAEAAFRNNDETTAKQALKDAIDASLAKYGASDAAWVTAKQTAIDALTGNALLTEIMTQKYIDLMYSPESFVDYRRTGIPALTPTFGNKVARRYPYAQNERTYNSNTPSVPDVFAPVWWDK